MNYRISEDYQTPYRIYPFVDELSPYKLQFTLKIKATQPHDKVATQVVTKFKLPRATEACTFEIPQGVKNQVAEYKSIENQTEWVIGKFVGGYEHAIVYRIPLKAATAQAVRKEIGPISLNFEIPMFNVSELQVKCLKTQNDEQGYDLYHWLRYVTQSNSYACRC